jgi:hypothetical protein
VDCFDRIGWTFCVGIGGQIGSEYAEAQAGKAIPAEDAASLIESARQAIEGL